jgi:gliding motility-associated-like protein
MLKQKVYILFLTVEMLLAGLHKAGAQQAVTVVQGSTHAYSVSPVPNGAPYSYVWSVSGGTSSKPGNSNSIGIVWDGAPGQYTLSVYMVNNLSNCPGNVQNLVVNVIPKATSFSIYWQTDTTNICASHILSSQEFSIGVAFSHQPGTCSFEYQLNNSTPVTVQVNNENTKTINFKGIQNPSGTEPELYNIRITKLTTPDGKTTVFDGTETEITSHRHVIKVNPLPVVFLGRDTFLCSPEKLLLDAQNAEMNYEWSNGSRNQTIWAYEGDGEIWVKVASDNNCVATDTIRILPCSPVNYLLIPNVFTPNGDGVNEVWRIGGLQYFPKADVKIFDRWGRLVFKSEPGYPRPWDGEVKGKLAPMDAYFYIIDLKNGTDPLRGSVTLIP